MTSVSDAHAVRVLYDAQIFRQQRYGGISRYFCELAARVGRTPGFDMRVLAPHHQNGYLADVDRAHVIGWHSPRARRLVKWSRRAARVVERVAPVWFDPAVVHETYYWGPLVSRRGAARVLTVYDMIHERFPQQFAASDPTVAAKRAAVARADHIICISENTRVDLMELLDVPASKVSVVYLAAQMAAPAGALPRGTPPYLLYVGERGGYKNFMGLMAAVAASRALDPVNIACFGGGPLGAAEWLEIDRLGLGRERVVHHAGDDAALATLYAQALCFVYPSRYEGFGIPPLEAMSCDCPVACSQTSSIPEVVGDAGVYFDPRDVGSIRQALERIVGSDTLRDELRARGRQQLRKFSWDRCAAETCDVYRRLAGNRSGPHA